ncbi:MAG: DUF4388 domain-containing protein [Synechococcaceae cyanobacterium]|nr:DUF4388 domain-containing protein [Synechococcaceae cyanobacterium]
MEFSGRLAAFPIGDILQWAHHDRRSGALVVRRSGREKRVYFRDGEIVACFSDEAAEFFGQHLLNSGRLEEGRLIQALTHCKQSGGRLGRTLVELGLLSREEVEEALRAHVEDLVCDLFLWPNGIFFFLAEEAADEQGLPEPLPCPAVALEGSRRADEHERIRRLFVHDQVVLRRGDESAASPAALEKRILSQVDGERGLEELYREVRGSWFRFLEAAYGLTVAGVLDIADVREPVDSHSSELRLADLLIEQLTEEQSVFQRRELMVPFEALERSVPAWIRPPKGEPAERLSGPARAFYETIDGRRTVGELLAVGDREERARRMDRLVLLLRDGAIALLPLPVEELSGLLEASGSDGAAAWLRRLRTRAS